MPLPTSTLTNSLQEVLEEYWGYDSFRPLQQPAMEAILQGRDSLVILPTGGGKSLCYQAPALAMAGVAIVVSPLISLMKDQVDALQACGAPAAFLNSSMTPDEKRQVTAQLRNGELRLLYAAPERLLMEHTLNFLKSIDVSFVAIDEAHCVSSWGHDFRPEYTGLAALKQALPGVGMHAFTATAAEKVRGDIIAGLGLQDPELLIGSFDRPNLVYRIRRGVKKLEQILEVIAQHPGESGIVYCVSRNEVEQTAAQLRECGVKAAPYHAGLGAEARARNQEGFLNDRLEVIVATVAFGMGIDKPNVRFVVHSGMPKSLEGYVQESGRAGRDGLEADCLLLYGGGDRAKWQRMIADSEQAGQPGALRSLEEMASYASSVGCRHRSIVEYFDQAYDRDNCEACDVCLGELTFADEPLILAQKIISCVARLDQRFGASHTVKVLTGSRDKRVLELRHDQLSTYGLLQQERTTSVREWISQLVGQGFLEPVGEYGVLQITNRGRQVLRGEITPQLLAPAKPTNEPKRQAGAGNDSWEGVDRTLFETLRELRSELASEQGVPAYVVFGDAALRDMARRRPTTREAFAHVRGVGARKLEDYGELFLAVIRATAAELGLATDLATETEAHSPAPRPTRTGPRAVALPAFELFREGHSLDQVSQQLGKAYSTVVGYLQEYISHYQLTDPTPWVDAALARRIEEAFHETGSQHLKPIYEHLGGQVTYEQIRIVVACLTNRAKDF